MQIELPEDTVVGPGVQLLGPLKVGARVIIEANCIIGYRQHEQSYVPPCIGSGCRIGPFCIVQAGTILENEVILEPFVSIGAGSHVEAGALLTYRADVHENARIGARCIVGGFICDRATIGAHSRVFGSLIHRSNPPLPWDTAEEPSPVLEENVFVGFGALVIGKVTVHRGAYIAAGAIVTRDVPAGAVVKNVNQIADSP